VCERERERERERVKNKMAVEALEKYKTPSFGPPLTLI
jgi:hypothetical protein